MRSGHLQGRAPLESALLSERPLGAERSAAIPVVVLAASLSLATILRVMFLGHHSFWYDEAVSTLLALVDWRSFYQLVTTWESNMILYHALLHFWVKLVGEGETAIRALSVIWSVATLPVVYGLGSRLFGRRAGIISALLLAVNAFHISYAQEARAYSMVAFFVTLACYFFVAGVETGSRASWAGYSVATALATYSHFFGVFVIPATWMSLLFLKWQDIPWKKVIVSTAVAVLLVSPLVFVIVTMNIARGKIDGIPPTQLRTIARTANAFAGAGGFYAVHEGATIPTANVIARRLLLIAYTALGLLGLGLGVHSLRSYGASTRTWRVGFVLTWLVLPIALTIAISFVKPLFIIRYLIISVPALMLLGAFAISQMRSRWVGAAVTGIVLVLGVHGVGMYYFDAKKEDWRGFTRYILAHAEGGDAIRFYPDFANRPFRYYYRKLRDPTRDPSLFIVSDSQRFSSLRDPTRDPSLIILSDSQQFPSSYKRLWLVVAHEERFGPFAQVTEIEMARDHSLLISRDFHPEVPARILLVHRIR